MTKEYIYNTVNDELYKIIKDMGDMVIINCYGDKLIVNINDVWKRVFISERGESN